MPPLPSELKMLGTIINKIDEAGLSHDGLVYLSSYVHERAYGGGGEQPADAPHDPTIETSVGGTD